MTEGTRSAVIGLLGAVIGAVAASGGDIYKSWRDKSEEKDHVTRALLTEAHHLGHTVADHRRWWTCEVDPEKPPQLIPFRTDIYDNLSKQISLLDSDVAQRIVEFYAAVHFINALQSTKNDPGFYCQYRWVIGERFDKEFGPPDSGNIFAQDYSNNYLRFKEIPAPISSSKYAPTPPTCPKETQAYSCNPPLSSP